MVEIIQFLGTSSLMALPAEADFDAPIAPEVHQSLATDTTDARDRARLFHLAWDVSCSALSGRQVLYERMFGGNPVCNAMTLFHPTTRHPSGSGSATFWHPMRMGEVHRFVESAFWGVFSSWRWTEIDVRLRQVVPVSLF
jgi:4-hydroxyphenylacetate 3-monooxygenase